MATQLDKDRDEAMSHAEEIGAKTPGEARAKVQSDENLAATAREHAAAKGKKQSNIEQALASLGLTLRDIKAYREDAGVAIVEPVDGGPARRVVLSEMYQPMIERALDRLGIEKSEIKAAPGASPAGYEIPVKGIKKDDPRFAGQKGVSTQDGMVFLDRQAMVDQDDPSAKPHVKKAVAPVAQDLEASAITKLGLKRQDVKSVKRDGEEMVLSLHNGDVKRVRIGTL